MKKHLLALTVLAFVLAPAQAFARTSGSHSSHRSHTSTGSSSAPTASTPTTGGQTSDPSADDGSGGKTVQVHGYTTRSGRHVNGYTRRAPAHHSSTQSADSGTDPSTSDSTDPSALGT